MEIKFDNVRYKKTLYQVDVTIQSGVTNAIFGKNIELFLNLLLKKEKIHSGRIIYKGFDNRNFNVTYVDLDNINFEEETVKSEINYYCKLNKIKNKTFKKNIEEYIKFFVFDDDFLNKKIYQLSISERKKFYVFLKTLFKYDFVILKNPYKHFDSHNISVINKLIKKICDENKFILLVDDDINKIYNISDYIIYLDENSLFKKINTKELPNFIDELLEKKLKIPDVLLLTYLAKTDKKVKLTYLKDVRDVIKDIYKHV